MENSISSDLIRGHIDTIILRTVAVVDKNSQEISDEIAEKSDGKYELKQATLYSSLKRLESENCLKSFWKDSENGRRKYFHLTEKGLALMNRNLSDWEFSRAIIDTLVDAKPPVATFVAPQPTIAVTTVDPIQNLINGDAPVENNLNNENSGAFDTTVSVKTAPISNEIQQLENTTVQNEIKEEVSQEVNFRNILNGLIKSQETIKQRDETVETNPAIVTQSVVEKPEQVDFSTQIKSLNTVKDGKIDFSDIIDDCAKDNIKVKISQKNTAVTSAGIKIYTVTMISSIMIFTLLALELVLFRVTYNEFLSNNFLLLILASAVFPAIMIFRAIKNPSKVVYRYLSVKNVLLMAFIVFFDLALLNVAVVFLVGADLSVKATLVKAVILPLTFYLNAFLYFVIRSIFISGDMFKVMKK